LLTEEATGRLPVCTEIQKKISFLVQPSANITKLAVNPQDYPSFILLLAPVSSVLELTTDPVIFKNLCNVLCFKN